MAIPDIPWSLVMTGSPLKHMIKIGYPMQERLKTDGIPSMKQAVEKSAAETFSHHILGMCLQVQSFSIKSSLQLDLNGWPPS